MSLLDLLNAGRLDEAIGDLTQQVKREPSNAEPRSNLAACFALRGEYARAMTHLEAIAAQDAAMVPGAQLYGALLAAEEQRGACWNGTQPFELWPNAGGATQRRAILPALAARATTAEIEPALADLAPLEPRLAGTLDGVSFAELVDSDDLLGPNLEAFIAGRCLWIPFGSIHRLVLEPPHALFDLLWARARLTDWHAQEITLHLPALYPHSHASRDGLVRTGRKTEWLDLDGVALRGQGQRVWLADDREVSLLELRELVFTQRPPLP